MAYLDKLKLLTAWDTEPALSEDDLNAVLASSAKEDAAGFAPDNEAWTPSYDLYSAAAEAWMIKAGRASATVEIDPPSGTVTSKVFENCRMMARICAARRIECVTTR